MPRFRTFLTFGALAAGTAARRTPIDYHPPMRWFCIALLAIGCGNNGTSDAAVAVADARPAADAPLPDAAPPDAGLPDASALGRLCVTTADGGAGSCPSGIVCCSAGGTTVCREPADCPEGPGYKMCTGASDCQGSICCRVSTMQFCTKPSACSSYGGTEVP